MHSGIYQVSLSPENRETVHLYQDIAKSLHVTPLEQAKSRKVIENKKSPVQRIDFSKEKPLVIEMEGAVEAGAHTNEAILDFGDFGRAVAKLDSPIEFFVGIEPVKTDSFSSGEWPFSNHVIVTVK